MSEWKRVFSDTRRLILALTVTALCAVLFLSSLLYRIEPGAFGDMLAAQKAARTIYSQCEDKSCGEIIALCDEITVKISAYCSYINGGTYADENGTFDDVEAYVSEMFPRLISLSDDAYDVNRSGGVLLTAVNEIRAEAEHIDGYGDYLSSIEKQAQVMSGVGIFQGSVERDGFTSENIKKTADDYAEMRDVEVIFANGAAVEHWISYSYADYFFLVMIVLIVLAFLEDRKGGLWHVIRSCKNGRASLGITRLEILICGSLVSTVLIYCVPLMLSCAVSGGIGDVQRPIQSLVSFRSCTAAVSVLGWLVRYFILKVLSGVFIGLLFWCVLGTLSSPQFSLAVLGAVLVSEYALYEFVPAGNALDIFKYLNIFSYIRISDLYTDYVNINMFGQALGVRGVMLSVMVCAVLGLAVFAVLIQAKRRPEGHRSILSGVETMLSRFLDVIRTRLSLGGWEMYKSLVYGGGIIIVAAVVILGGSLDFRGIVPVNGGDYVYNALVIDREGVIDDSFDEYVERIRESDAGAELANVADRLERDADAIRERATVGGYEPWLVYETNYRIYFGDYAVSVQRLNSTAAILFTVFLCVSGITYEYQSGTVYMVRSLKRGRSALLTRKLLAAALFAVIAWASVYLREISDFIAYCQPKTFSAPVQNLGALAQFPLKITIGQYILLLNALRLVMLTSVSFISLFIGSFTKNVLGAYLLGTAVLVLPAVLTVLGLDVMKYFSLVLPVSAAELLWSMGGGSVIYALPWVVAVALGIAAVILTRKRWVGEERRGRQKSN